ncbi:GNAT family N-acetyltransferase [Algibacter pectinivorans]|uniref:Acetyltransferase (GNAT) domain-containing protein n=1 Tax=Algibacter pectinivorans TaxID=870482 RepID=A0A1I1RT09_9FLAO|nr:GNAT family N-acetyltransferase [Algibacter pectinivorans]SFD37464.1 Acetyltransferase (GNAT) domain-containing protein [Algibacter pectinivorans]
MTIKTYDAFTRLSFMDINRITNFIHENAGEFKDSKSAITKAIKYAAKEIPGLGGYVFIMQENDDILGVVVVNRTGMNEYLSENILVYLAVKQGFRQSGIAKALIKHTIDYCSGEISIHININDPVIKLFQKQGFKARNIELRLDRLSFLNK